MTVPAEVQVSSTATLGDLVARRPSRAELFERLRFDYCCGGTKTLAEACREQGLDPEAIRRMIVAQDNAPEQPIVIEQRDWREASLTGLCEHIVEVHHNGLRRHLPRVGELLSSVMRVHGPVHLRLRELPETFAALRGELEPHLELEEQVLFPACRELEAGTRTALDEALLGILEHDHREVGDALAKLRELTDGYDPSGALCRTHHHLLDALRALELDLHQHVHEENNILLPRIRSILNPPRRDAALDRAARQRGQAVKRSSMGGDLPACCQGWLAEQAHLGYRRADRTRSG